MEQVPKEGVSPVQEPGAGEKRGSRKKFWAIFALFFVVLVIISLYLAWQWYLSPQAVQRAQLEENMRLYTTAMRNYEDAMRADTYGSSTPEGTLQMFIAALKNEDVELASKYFLLDDTGSRTKWEEGLLDVGNNGRAQEVISAVQKVIGNKTQEDSAASFESLDSNGIVDVLIDMKLNKYSGVWKIESM